MENRTVAPWIRAWAREDREWKESQYCRKAGRKFRAAWYAWLAVVVAVTAAVAMDAQHRERQAAYRSLPSADEVMMWQAHRPFSEVEAAQAAAIRREYGRIAGATP